MTTALPKDPKWLKAAFSDLGLHEVKGRQHNDRIVEMFTIAGHPEIKDDETAWCSAAVNTWMVEAGLRGTGALNARSWLTWGRPVNTDKAIPRGAVLVFRRGNSSWQGHVCLLLEDNGRTLVVLGGNQGDSVSIARYSREALLGARLPNTAGNSVTLKAAGTSAASQVVAQGVSTAADTLTQNADSLTTALDTAKSDITPYIDMLTYAKWAFVAISLASLAFAGYRFFTKHIKAAPEPEVEEEGASIDDGAQPTRARRR